MRPPLEPVAPVAVPPASLRIATQPAAGLTRRVLNALDRQLAWVFLAPGVLVLALILAYPIVSNFALSVTDAHLMYRGVHWVGLENFRTVLGDSGFWSALRNSVVWTAGSVALQLVLGLVAALLLDQRIRARGLFRSLLIIPYAFPPITMAFLWRWLLNSLYGIYNYLLVWAGLVRQPVAWFLDPTLAMVTIIGVNVWFGYPLMMLAILAGLQAIPRDFYEVAQIEGASYLQTLRHVIWPSIAKIVGIMVVLRSIWVFNNFDLVFLLTGGGPVNATETLPLYAYRTGWQVYHIGRSAAIGVLLFGIVSLMAWLYFRALRIEEEAR
jgi:multiple sugar transport system permease protein